jgi:predicted metal-dependent hydrolase
MTTLQVRRIRFDLDEDVPFLWNPGNPAFSLQMNATSIIAIAFERFIVAAVREALETMTGEIRDEAQAFMLQEGQHSRCHRQHVASLIRQYPGLQETLDAAVASFDRLTATRSLEYRLAYVADVEATFTPTFKMMLDHEDELFAPGDERVSSLFLWHFVEEVEHRSSGVLIYQAMVGDSRFRMRMAPSVVRHLLEVLRTISAGFNEHVPLTDRLVDARLLNPSFALRPAARRIASGYDCVPLRERLTTAYRIVLSQLPSHDPAHEPLPAFAEGWCRRYDDGADVAHWYSSQEE